MKASKDPAPDGPASHDPANPRNLPSDLGERLIVALDVPTIDEAEQIIADLDGIVSFFKIGLWLAFAEGVDGLIKRLIDGRKRVFLDTKMFDIPQTVEQGVARAADRGVSFVTVHGDENILRSAIKGKRGRDIKIFSITVLTSLNDAALREMGYALTTQELVHLRVREAIKYGCDGIIASAHDDPDDIRKQVGNEKLLIATPGIRDQGEPTADHKRTATAAAAIERGADYLVVGRPIITNSDRAARARRMIGEMQEGERRKYNGGPLR
jgi:orotidine-5'-phosphate decarboxylase